MSEEKRKQEELLQARVWKKLVEFWRQRIKRRRDLSANQSLFKEYRTWHSEQTRQLRTWRRIIYFTDDSTWRSLLSASRKRARELDANTP